MIGAVRFRSRVAHNALIVALAVASHSARAQEAAVPASGQQGVAGPTVADTAMADIVVTAQFRNQSIQSTPLSITAISAELLQARGQTDIAQIAQQIPNVTLVQGGGIFGPSVGAQIRGVGQFDSNPAYEPGVGLYVDDVYIATLNGAVLDLLDLERVEVLRGPQGTLTGRNSIGGAIKLFSRKPDGNNDASFEIGGGSRNLLSARASLGFKITDSLSGRASFVHKEQDGFIRRIDYGCANPGNPEGVVAKRATGDCVVGKLGGENYSGARLALRYQNDSLDWLVTGDYSTKDSPAAGEVVTLVDPSRVPASFNCGRFCTYADFSSSGGRPLLGAPSPLPGPGSQLSSPITIPDSQTHKGWGISSNVRVELAEHIDLTSISAYRRYRTTFASDVDYGPEPSPTSGLPVVPGFSLQTFRHRFFSQELRLSGSIGSLVEWTVGGFYSDQKTLTYSLTEAGYVIPGLGLQVFTDDPVNASSKAAYATAIVRPSESVTLTGGLRYTEEAKDHTFVRRNLDGSVNTLLDPTGEINGLVSKSEGNRIDYRISLDYRFSPELLAYSTVSTGFKGGGVTARPFDAAQAKLGAYGPETLTAYEIGLKTDLFNRRLRINLAGFINDYKDVQLQIQDCADYGGGPVCAVIANAGNARFKGVEAELTAQPIHGLTIDGSVSYISATWKSLSPAVIGNSVTRPNGVFMEDPATTAPKWKASAGIQYKMDLGSSGSLSPRLDYAYGSRRFQGRATSTPYYLPGYSLVNGRLTWQDASEKISISLEALNLLNKYYYTARFDAVFFNTGTAFSTVGQPREFSLKARYNF